MRQPWGSFWTLALALSGCSVSVCGWRGNWKGLLIFGAAQWLPLSGEFRVGGVLSPALPWVWEWQACGRVPWGAEAATDCLCQAWDSVCWKL